MRARESMREIQQWLEDVSIDHYTDIEVSIKGGSLRGKAGAERGLDCMSKSLLQYPLVMAADHVTDNLDCESFCQLPLVPEKQNKLNLTLLREAVQSHGRLRDARLISTFEIGSLKDEGAKQVACRSLLEVCGSPGPIEPV